MRILVINGPNLNLLEKRDKKIYGDTSLAKISEQCHKLAQQLAIEVDFKQSNHEGEIIDYIQQAIEDYSGIIINAGAYSHSSIAIRDALEIFNKPKIELHLSNIYKREAFRQHSTISAVVDAVISGLGADGYQIALLAIKELISNNQS